MKSKKLIAFIVATGGGIKPNKYGIQHIINNIDSEEELTMVKEHAKKTTYCGDDWEEFKAEILKIKI